MTLVFYIAAVVAVVSTILVIRSTNAVYGLLYLTISLLAVAAAFYTLGAPLAAALEVMIYAGAIMVMFLFVVQTLNLGPPAEEQERRWLTWGIWTAPILIGLLLLAEIVYIAATGADPAATAGYAGTEAVALTLIRRYDVGVEMASLLLLSGLIAAYHLGRRFRPRMSDAGKAANAKEEESS